MKLPNKRDVLLDLQDGLYWLRDNWRRPAKRGLKYLLISIPFLVIIWQFTYSGDKLPMFMKIDGLSVGGQDKERVAKDLNKAYREKLVNLYIADEKEAFATPNLASAGLTVDNSSRVESVDYPWYFRLVPTSAFWIKFLVDVPPADYASDQNKIREFVIGELGRDCKIAPVNPSVEVSQDKLSIKPGSNGGTCELDDVVSTLQEARPVLYEQADVRVGAETVPPAIELSQLEGLVETIEDNLYSGVSVLAAGEEVKLDSRQLRGWLEFQTEGEEIVVSINSEKAGETLTNQLGDKLSKPAGVTKVTTRDFAEISRQDGESGQEFDIEGTLVNIVARLMDKAEAAEAAVKPVSPRVEYTRTYSPTHEGLSALIKNYAADKPGKYGVSLVELSGERRSAGVNEGQKFTTASTYKVYVAYSVLRRIESGEFKWNNPVGSTGRNLDKCFYDMIAQSDNPCAEALVDRIGYTPLHNDVQNLGLGGTSFIDKESFKTAAGDLSRFMAMLETGQLPISDKNQERFLEALRRNVYRQGVPAGVTGEVADKVGFLDRFLHDTAIVYSPAGTYVLTIMTESSSWANIADLARQIEGLRG